MQQREPVAIVKATLIREIYTSDWKKYLTVARIYL